MEPDDQEAKKKLVESLTREDLSMLSDDQIRVVDSIAMEKVNPRAIERVEKAMEGKEKDILRSLTEDPYIYTSDEISVLPTMNVRFSSTLSSQELDCKEAVNEVTKKNETMDLVSARVNLIFMAHGLTFVNGDPCAGVSFNNEAEDLREHLEEIRERRRDWLMRQPAPILDRLVEFHRAFQLQINSLTKDEKLLSKVGN